MESRKNDVTGIEVKYPMLIESTISKIVVLMTKPKCGVVVYVPEEDDPTTLGDYSDDWNISYFKPYTGEITLKN